LGHFWAIFGHFLGYFWAIFSGILSVKSGVEKVICKLVVKQVIFFLVNMDGYV